MKTYKQFQESVTKALKMFGSKGIRKVEPNVEIDGVGRFNPDMDLKQFNRTQDLKSKYNNSYANRCTTCNSRINYQKHFFKFSSSIVYTEI